MLLVEGRIRKHRTGKEKNTKPQVEDKGRYFPVPLGLSETLFLPRPMDVLSHEGEFLEKEDS